MDTKELFYKVVKLDMVTINVDLLMTTFYYSGKLHVTHLNDATIRVRNVYMDDKSVLHVGKDTVVDEFKYVPAFDDVDNLFRRRFNLNTLALEALEGSVIKTDIVPGDFCKPGYTLDIAWSETSLLVNDSFGIKNKAYNLTCAGVNITTRTTNGELFDRKSVIDFVPNQQPEFDFTFDN